MSLLSLQIPRISYIAFELVEVDMDALLKDKRYKANQVKAIDLAVLPEQLTYRLQSRDAITQTYSDVFVQRYEMQPERVRFSGTFGDDYRLVNNQYLDGWQRLKQFEEDIVRRKGHKNPNKIYCINYYDFVFQRFGSINIDSWSLNADGRTNSNLINYTLEFTIVGEIIDVNTLDAFIKNLVSGVFFNVSISRFNILDTFVLSGLNYADYGVEILKELDAKLEDALSKFSNSISQPALKFVEDIFG